MAGSVNKVTLIGNLGKDPEVRSTPNGKKIVSFSIATGESWNDKETGERKEKTEWHNIVVFNDRAADYAERFLRKGNKVYVEGALQTRKWTDKEGKDRYTTEIILSPYKGELTGLTGQPAAAEGDEPASQQAAAPRTQTRAARPAPVVTPDLDDEIPF